MTTTKIDALRALHAPEAWREPMVYSVWEDGEVTLEKGGDLFGQRNLHCTVPALEGAAVPIESMPVQSYGHGRIFVMTREDALRARAIIAGE